MPTYVCRAAALDEATMAALAVAIASVHSEVTGANGYFAQVSFEPLDPARCYIGGLKASGDHCFVHGHIRAGRSARDRATLIERIVEAVVTVLAIPPDAVGLRLRAAASRDGGVRQPIARTG